MKNAILPVALGLLLTLTPAVALALGGENDITPLSNKDVLVMVQQHQSEEAIIKAIKTSPCTFDTFPPVLKDMKRRGVPDAVLQAMIQAPYGPAAQQAAAEMTWVSSRSTTMLTSCGRWVTSRRLHHALVGFHGKTKTVPGRQERAANKRDETLSRVLRTLR